MTDFQSWEKKARDLVKQSEEEEKSEKLISDKLTGHDSDQNLPSYGPSIAKSREEAKLLAEKSDERRKILERLNEVEETWEEIVDGVIGEGMMRKANGNHSGSETKIQNLSSCDVNDSDEILVEDVTNSTVTNQDDTETEASTPDKNVEVKSISKAYKSTASIGESIGSTEPSDSTQDPNSNDTSKLKIIIIQANQKAIRLFNCKNSHISIRGRCAKVLVTNCQNLTVDIGGKDNSDISTTIISSSADIWNCEDIKFNLYTECKSIQCDSLKTCAIRYARQEYLGEGFIIHHNCINQLSYYIGNNVSNDDKIEATFVAEPNANTSSNSSETDPSLQYVTQLVADLKDKDGKPLLFTRVVQRHAEKEFPTFLSDTKGARATNSNTQSEIVQSTNVDNASSSSTSLLIQARSKREEANSAFKSADFYQASALYSVALDGLLMKIESDEKNKSESPESKTESSKSESSETKSPESSDLHQEASTILCNRAQCWLKLGHLDRALQDAEKAISLQPKDNIKGYFRKGMALHGLERYEESLRALGIAEKLDGKNKQIKDAIGMVSLKMRRVREKENTVGR